MELSKKMKRFVIILAVIIALISSAYALFELKSVKYGKKQEVLYSYQSKGNIDYKVFLKPNVMYGVDCLKKDRNYVLKYINYINLMFRYEFKGNAPADLKTDYFVKAYLWGLHGKENEVLWSKEFVLLPKKVEQEENKNKVIELKLPLKLDSYLALKETIFKDSEVNSPVVLKVVFDVYTLASTKNGALEDRMSSSVAIPIGESVFKIECDSEVAGKDSIIEPVKYELPVNMGRVAAGFAVSFIFLVITILSAVFIKETIPLDDFEKRIAQIFKEYGERLAGMENAITYQFTDIININSIEDMIKIADEVGQPVFYYKVNSSTERKIEFYVFDSSRIYYMVIFGEIKPEAESLLQVDSSSAGKISL